MTLGLEVHSDAVDEVIPMTVNVFCSRRYPRFSFNISVHSDYAITNAFMASFTMCTKCNCMPVFSEPIRQV